MSPTSGSSEESGNRRTEVGGWEVKEVDRDSIGLPTRYLVGSGRNDTYVRPIHGHAQFRAYESDEFLGQP